MKKKLCGSMIANGWKGRDSQKEKKYTSFRDKFQFMPSRRENSSTNISRAIYWYLINLLLRHLVRILINWFNEVLIMVILEWQSGKCDKRRWKMCHRYLNGVWISRCLPRQNLLKWNHFVRNYENCHEILCKENSEHWPIFNFEKNTWSNINRVLQKNTYITVEKKNMQAARKFMKKKCERNS